MTWAHFHGTLPVGTTQQHRELLAAVARRRVLLADGAGDGPGQQGFTGTG